MNFKILWTILTSASIGALAAIWLRPSAEEQGSQDSSSETCCLRDEYDSTESILLSEHLFAPKYGGAEIAKAIIDLGVDVVVLTNEPWDSQTQDQSLADWGIQAVDRGRLSFITAPHSSPWIRDFAPLFLHDDSQASKTTLVDFDYRNDAMLDDSLSYLLAMQWKFSVRHIPVLMDGGNFLSSNGRCFAAAALDANSSFVESFLSFRSAGCKEIAFVPDAFHEHIDMFVKFVDDKTALINRIEPEALAFSRNRFEADYAEIELMAKALDQAAEIIEKTHRVIRLPTPLPILNLRRTFTNALLINKTVFLPRYRASFRTGEQYPDDQFLGSYEPFAEKIYASLGFSVKTFPADGLIADGGALHCALVQLPFRIAELSTR